MGCFIGWIIELFFRNLVDKEKINPGFLRGPYLPIYGLSILSLYIISNLKINLVHKIILLILLPITMELLTGLFFEKYFRIKLWDYNHKFLNYKGIICLQFSIYWGVLALFYYFILHDVINNYLLVTLSNINYIFFYGIIAGVFLLDIFYSFNIAFKVKEVAKEFGKKKINFSKFNGATNIFNNIRDTIKEKLY